MSSSRPAASASAVRCRSSGDGVGSPDGWLWTRITPAALSRTASRNSSPTRTSDDADVALVDGRHAQDVVLRVEHHDPQLLALEAAHLEDQPIGDVVRAADRPARRRPVGEQPAPELEGGDQLGRLRLADPGDLGQLELRRPGEPGQAVVARQRIRRQVDRRPAARPRAPDQRDQLGGRQAARARAWPAAPAAARRPAAPGSPGRSSRPSWPSARRRLVGQRPPACTRPERRRWRSEGVPGPERREPADSPRHPDLEDVAEPSGRALIGRLIRRCTAAHRGERRSDQVAARDARRLGDDQEDRR